MKAKGSKVTDSELSEMLHLRCLGYTLAEIASLTARGYSTVAWLLPCLVGGGLAGGRREWRRNWRTREKGF